MNGCTYHFPIDTLYHYVKADFYSHLCEPTLEGELGPFQMHRTRQPLPNADITLTTITMTPNAIILDETTDPGEL